MCDSLKLSILDPDEQTASTSTIGEFRAGKPLVLDFWTTRCVRCPAALAKLDGEAPKHAADAMFASCAMSLNSETEGTQDQVLEQLEGQMENLKHTYMTFEEKEAAKSMFGFTAVPFAVVVGADGNVLAKGNPNEINFASFNFSPPSSPSQPAANALGFGNDDEDVSTARLGARMRKAAPCLPLPACSP